MTTPSVQDFAAALDNSSVREILQESATQEVAEGEANANGAMAVTRELATGMDQDQLVETTTDTTSYPIKDQNSEDGVQVTTVQTHEGTGKIWAVDDDPDSDYVTRGDTYTHVYMSSVSVDFTTRWGRGRGAGKEVACTLSADLDIRQGSSSATKAVYALECDLPAWQNAFPINPLQHLKVSQDQILNGVLTSIGADSIADIASVYNEVEGVIASNE